jgi:multiple sugar transport system substrate-binding protein
VNFIKNVDHSNVPFATSPFPVADSASQLYGSGQIGGTTIGIPRGTQHPDEAWLLVKYLALDPAGEKSLADQLRNIPTINSVLSDPVLTQDTQFATFLKIFPNPNSHYKQITKLGFGDVSLYDNFVDRYLAGKVADLHAGLTALASQIDKQLQLGQ